MIPGSVRASSGFAHGAAFYGSDDGFVDVVRPFIEQGVGAGEDVFVSCGARGTDAIRRAIADTSAITFGPSEGLRRPASAMKAWRETITDRVRRGTIGIRIVGEVPHGALAEAWGWWARYEATVNQALGGTQVRALCPYDERLVSDAVAADVRATHPYLVTLGGFVANPAYREPRAFLASRPAPPPDPLEASAPRVDLAEPSPREARDAVAWLARSTTVPNDDVEGLTIGVSEVVTNAIVHGTAPVRVRAWDGADRVVVTVADAGPGPVDPFTGLLPPGDDVIGGRGLWITHQLCDDVQMTATTDGFSIRLVAGRRA